MKCQCLFSGKNKKNLNIILSSAISFIYFFFLFEDTEFLVILLQGLFDFISLSIFCKWTVKALI